MADILSDHHWVVTDKKHLTNNLIYYIQSKMKLNWTNFFINILCELSEITFIDVKYIY